MQADVNAAAWLQAVTTRSYEDARRLLPPGQDVNVRGADGETAMHVLARQNRRDTIQAIVRDGANPFAADDQGRTPLRVAQELNHTDVVRFLIYHMELLRALAKRLERGPTHADIVAAMQDAKMVSFRLEVQQRVDENSEKLVSAARNGEFEVVKKMVEGGEITIDAVDAATGETAFAAALAAYRRRVVEYLIAHGAHVFAPCVVDGKTEAALVTAVSYGDVSLVYRFAGHGSLLDMPSIDRRTCPVAEAMKRGSIEMLEALLEIGVRASSLSAGRIGSDPRDVVVVRPTFRLLPFGTSPPDVDTPWILLQMACWLDDARLFQYLFSRFDVLNNRELIATRGGVPLRYAIRRQNEHLTMDLLDRGVVIHEEGAWNAIITAVQANSVRMLRLMLSRIDITVRSSNISPYTVRGLLAHAVKANAMDCAFELLPLETRPEFLDEALAEAARLEQFEFADALLEIALPSTFAVVAACIKATTCPLMLELLLTRCKVERFHGSSLDECLQHACSNHNAEVVSVLLAHGIDVNYDNDQGNLSPLVSAKYDNELYGVDIVRLLMENGHDAAITQSCCGPIARVEETPLCMSEH